MYLTPP